MRQRYDRKIDKENVRAERRQAKLKRREKLYADNAERIEGLREVTNKPLLRPVRRR